MTSPMPTSCPLRYSVEEMLSLRNSLPVVNFVVRKLNKHPDIAGIFRLPEEAFNDPERYYCQSQALVDVTNRRKVLHLGNRRTEGSSEEIEEQVVSSSKLANRSRQGQWHLRQRDSSHRSEPHPAPSDIASQQSENFQRFYRAVVSPTHIRVTAGGRIVPNTRAIAPPKFDWNPDKCHFESRRLFPDTDPSTSQAQTVWLPNSPQPAIGSPLPNYNFHPQSASLAQATMAAQNLSRLHGHIQTSSENDQPSKEATNDLLQSMNLQKPIKISPPSQFDHSRPFVFNGQVVYPVPVGFQPPLNSVPLPITVLGDPNLPHQVPTTGGFLPPSYPMPIPMPLMMPPGPVGHLPMTLPSGIPHVEAGLPMAPFMPQLAPGMVSLSELTRLQIHGFRNQVKHIDNQLANNQHLVDEPFLQRQRNELMVFIEKMEAMLQTQVGQEGTHASVVHLHGKSGENSSTETLTKQDISGGAERNKVNLSRSSIASNEELKKKSPTTAPQAIAQPIPLFVPTSQQSQIQTKSEGFQVTKTSVDSKPSTRSEPATKSRLTVAAAKAPPFQPRAHTMAHRSESDPLSDFSTKALNDSVTLPNTLSDLGTPQYGPSRNRRTTKSSSDWGQLMPHSGVNHASLARAHTMQAPHILDGNISGILQRSYTFHAPPSAYEAASKPGGAFFNSPRDTPYLVGTLPNGMHLSESNGSDFVYARPLTEDEVRARHLYWGDAPRSALKGSGLPKFDGKDFYPPSPAKSVATPAATSTAYPKSTTVHLPEFEKLFIKPEIPSYQTPSQVRTESSEQNLMPTPTRGFLENDIIGFQSPSPRPATYTFDNRLPQNWSSTQYGGKGDLTQKQITQPATTEAMSPVSDDFSNLFTSPTAPHHNRSTPSFRGGNIQPTTPHSKAFSSSAEGKEDEAGVLDSWEGPKNIEEWNAEELGDTISTKTNTNDSQSNSSTVEIRLTSKDKEQSPKRGYGAGFADRFANNNGGDQHTLFLQNMLRNTAAATMAAPALSGAVSSATAHGYLPQYRGSAAASLAPAMLNTMTTVEREDEAGGTKIDHIKISASGDFKVSTEGVAQLIAANFLPENRPINRDRPRRPVRASVETMGAEGYMRYLAQKAEDDKKILEQGWNSNTTGTGPVMGSDW